MKQLRVLLASETYPPDTNGAAIFVGRLADDLAQAGHEIMVVAPSTKFKDEIQKENNGLTVFRIRSISLKPIHPYFRAIFRINLTEGINAIADDFKPHIIHIHNHFLIGRACLAVAKKKNIPIIGTNHFMPDNLTEYFPKATEKTISEYMWKDFLKVYNQLAYVTAPSQAAVKMIRDLDLTVPTEVISNGIDLSKFFPKKVDKEIYKKYNIASHIPAFLFVGRLEKDKNIDLILKGLAIILKKQRIQAIIVGKGRDENRLKRLADKLNLQGRAIFTGRVPGDDLQQFYSLADVYIGSGTAELQGLAVMEAMASGLPVLAVNAVALPELVKDGVNGYLFAADDENDLADKMSKILSDKSKLKSMAAQSLCLIQAHDKKNTIKQFICLYRKIISSH
ncbi:MAG: glycosyltransferase family 4 protein [Nitrospirae bacterium]|nr:glycosyltransferase family 4 protein [Nitrospirota bacterium]